MSNRQIDLTKPSLAGLSYLLRNDAIWPIGFEWDYASTDICALGLASEYWDKELTSGTEFALQHFSMKECDADNIFFGKGDWIPKERTRGFATLLGDNRCIFCKVTPDMVADAIDDYLLRQAVDKPQVTAVAA